MRPTTSTKRVGIVFGTRPEAIKIAPVALALSAAYGFEPVLISSGQHRAMVAEAMAGFGLTTDVDLDLRPGRHLTDFVGDAVARIGERVRSLDLDMLLVQGDTSTALAGALAGFYSGTPVAHLEAGLRTDHPHAPFPEEANRRMITPLAGLHLAPTEEAARRLKAEGVDPSTVVVTGNTVVDALLETVRRGAPFTGPDATRLSAIPAQTRIVLVTAHRRESWGRGISEVSRAVLDIADAHPDVTVVLPVHPNPAVRSVVEAILAGRGRVILTGPLPYADMVRLLHRATLVVTDSGGLQEEACTLGRPTLVTRDTTERPEGVAAGGLRVVGTDRRRIAAEATALLTDQAAYEALVCRSMPFGDGLAAQRCVTAIDAYLPVPALV